MAIGFTDDGLTYDQRRACFEAARKTGVDEGIFIAFADGWADVGVEFTAQTLVEAWRDGPGAEDCDALVELILERLPAPRGNSMPSTYIDLISRS